jgi:hypothetical protein
MKSMLLAAVSVLALSSIGQARAESNGLAAVEPPQAAVPVLSSPPLGNTGSETYPSFAEGGAVPVMSGQVLPPNGSEGAVQSANSLPPGFSAGTPAYDTAASVQRYFAAQPSRQILARSIRRPNPG